MAVKNITDVAHMQVFVCPHVCVCVCVCVCEALMFIIRSFLHYTVDFLPV